MLAVTFGGGFFVNGQIEYLLTEAVRKRKKEAAADTVETGGPDDAAADPEKETAR